ncbi:MAG: twin-arginine translocation signal domain-containing protein [Acidobacteriales bacterium]|nr:MAG: twin-arginine translocation signal domain-containing protein [Terriglobales bacterium]
MACEEIGVGQNPAFAALPRGLVVKRPSDMTRRDFLYAAVAAAGAAKAG